MKEQRYPQLDERAVTATLPNGLPVCVVPKPGFAKSALILSPITVPWIPDLPGWAGLMIPRRGVAHYLEHKMFEMPDRDVMQEFSALGANPNAFTSYNMTAYYFTCTEHFEACLELLLTFVSTPYFTEESVERERGIIAQEIRMYEDSADSQVYEDLFAAMYRHHPVRVPIAGTVESIEAITPEILRSCYDAFYHPANMMLCVVGDVDPAQVVAAAERILPQERRPSSGAGLRAAGGAGVLHLQYLPADGCGHAHLPDGLQVPLARLWTGRRPPGAGRRPGGGGPDGESSRLYLELYQAGLIDSSFAAGYEDMPGVALLSCGGDSRNPEAVRDAICAGARRLAAEGVEEELFHRLKRSALGRRVRALDSFDSTCFPPVPGPFFRHGLLDLPGGIRCRHQGGSGSISAADCARGPLRHFRGSAAPAGGMTMLTYTEISFPGLGISLNPSAIRN